ncbi:MAG: hypothetical protein IJ017_02730 [Oscillospiraceae bacterium]|nr:hypothetical protein [Oscillospiraceae bacterium]
MSDRERLCSAVKRIAWGYVLIYLDININTVSILPNWLGYMFMLRALPDLSEEERSAELLKPLGTAMAVWELIKWTAVMFGVSFETGTLGTVLNIAGYVMAVVSMYFHFQLLTNLANAAEKYGSTRSRKILRLRTVNTVIMMILALPLPWYNIEAVAIALLIAAFVITMWTCYVLFTLKKELETIGI